MNRTFRVRERREGAAPGVAFVIVHSPAVRERGSLGKARARAGNGKYAVLRFIGIWRQVGAAAARRQAPPFGALPRQARTLIPEARSAGRTVP